MEGYFYIQKDGEDLYLYSLHRYQNKRKLSEREIKVLLQRDYFKRDYPNFVPIYQKALKMMANGIVGSLRGYDF